MHLPWPARPKRSCCAVRAATQLRDPSCARWYTRLRLKPCVESRAILQNHVYRGYGVRSVLYRTERPWASEENAQAEPEMKWSVLDQSPASAGSSQDLAIRDSLRLALCCDASGYNRFWVSGHRNSASIVGSAPEIVIAAIAATTPRIRVGSAGVRNWPRFWACPTPTPTSSVTAKARKRHSRSIGVITGRARVTLLRKRPFVSGHWRQTDAEAQSYTPSERSVILGVRRRAIAGTAPAVAARRHSYALLADALGLRATDLPPA